MPFHLLFVFAALQGQSAQAQQDLVECPGTSLYVNMNGEQKIYEGEVSRFGPPPEKQAFKGRNKQMQLRIVQPENACDEIEDDENILQDSVALVQRGNCSFVRKALNVQHTNASAMLLYNNEDACIVMNYASGDEIVEEIKIPSVSVSSSVGEKLIEAAGQNATVFFEVEHVAQLDPADIIIFIIALATLLWGSLWAGHGSKVSASGYVEQETNSDARNEKLYINEYMAFGFIFFAAIMLIVLFFILNKIGFYLVLFIFCIASISSMTFVVQYPLGWLFCQRYYLTLGVSTVLSIWTVVVWAIFRNEPYLWIVQDFFGMCLVAVVLKTLRLQNIKVAFILLVLMLMYDVFFVFITPLFMKGESVMVKVATGGSAQELLPMLFKAARFDGHVFSLMGYGDVVLPGLLVAFTRIYDLREGKRILCGYFLWTYLGYAIGLILTYGAMCFQIGGSQGQPALLYLVPCTLGIVLILSLVRGEFVQMWRGKQADRYDRVATQDEDDVVEGEVIDVEEDNQEVPFLVEKV
eukprot:TRINITY_DN1832_c0_g1_i4.p1 TRINITY_DN1832_c0_g1~~TRINITY_DN1832_c0_g1_i4.p1  ORF type:complete len:523 (+),score=73.41 TRINITY_DN1832_c0_g1_i4:68-1636(+)